MRTMSWSRYHYLRRSFMRIRRHLRGKRTALRRLREANDRQGARTDRSRI
jgi:hypothetical protein